LLKVEERKNGKNKRVVGIVFLGDVGRPAHAREKKGDHVVNWPVGQSSIGSEETFLGGGGGGTGVGRPEKRRGGTKTIEGGGRGAQ